eukprot:Phypoly_transcript_12995.p1 GENE.Phypoly_transcript_12995~~Phypoly_transcript_12995.p1  ORF type:complete len:117 (+),score=15.82 Phypoly_transcript_12995:531-881(+)
MSGLTQKIGLEDYLGTFRFEGESERIFRAGWIGDLWSKQFYLLGGAIDTSPPHVSFSQTLYEVFLAQKNVFLDAMDKLVRKFQVESCHSQLLEGSETSTPPHRITCVLAIFQSFVC